MEELADLISDRVSEKLRGGMENESNLYKKLLKESKQLEEKIPESQDDLKNLSSTLKEISSILKPKSDYKIEKTKAEKDLEAIYDKYKISTGVVKNKLSSILNDFFEKMDKSDLAHYILSANKIGEDTLTYKLLYDNVDFERYNKKNKGSGIVKKQKRISFAKLLKNK